MTSFVLLQHKVWVKPSSEMTFLYGNNIPKSGVGRMTDDTPQYAGVVIYNMSDVPLGERPLCVPHASGILARLM